MLILFIEIDHTSVYARSATHTRGTPPVCYTYTGAHAPIEAIKPHRSHTMSTSVLSSASQATINVFETLSTTANAATKLVTGIATGANMFERMMQDMDNNHAMRSIINQATYKKELAEDAARATAKRQYSIQKELAEDSNFKKLFEENYLELKALLEPETSE